ncbi:MAG: type II toxin-antitoxin system VapC family toxin [Thermoanaerobaculia bacterium]
MQLLGLDSMVFAYHFQREPIFGGAATRLLAFAEEGRWSLVASVVALLEVLVIPKRLRQEEVCRSYRDFFLSLPTLSLEPVSLDIAQVAADLRARYHIATPDSIHVATAIQAGADAFVSEDRRLKRIVEIPVLTLAEALARVGAIGAGEVHEPRARYGGPRRRRVARLLHKKRA